MVRDLFTVSPFDPAAMIIQHEMLDPAVYRAQRMAELEQIAKYRAEKIGIYIAWSKDPEKTASEIYERTKAAGEMIVPDLDPTEVYKYTTLQSHLKLTPIYKPMIKDKWHVRLWKKILKIVE